MDEKSEDNLYKFGWMRKVQMAEKDRMTEKGPDGGKRQDGGKRPDGALPLFIGGGEHVVVRGCRSKGTKIWVNGNIF